MEVLIDKGETVFLDTSYAIALAASTDSLRLLQALEVDPTIEIVPLSDRLYSSGMTLFRSRPDKVGPH